LGNSEPLKLDSNGKRYLIGAAILIFLIGIYYLLRRNVKQSNS